VALSETIRRLRAERLWSQRELAKQAGVSPTTISKIEGDDPAYDPSLGTLAKLARALRVRPNALLSPDELEALAQKKIQARAA
jgi:transcriptional regulator with XRE-family HTH domain